MKWDVQLRLSEAMYSRWWFQFSLQTRRRAEFAVPAAGNQFDAKVTSGDSHGDRCLLLHH